MAADIFIRNLKGLGFKIKLDTNGSLPDKLKVLLDEELVDYVALDLKAPLDKYSFFTHDLRINDKWLETYSMLQSSNIKFEVRSTMIKELYSLNEFIEQIDELKLSKIYLQKFNNKEVHDFRFVNYSGYNSSELNQIRSKLLKSKKVKSCSIRN